MSNLTCITPSSVSLWNRRGGLILSLMSAFCYWQVQNQTPESLEGTRTVHVTREHWTMENFSGWSPLGPPTIDVQTGVRAMDSGT